VELTRCHSATRASNNLKIILTLIDITIVTFSSTKSLRFSRDLRGISCTPSKAPLTLPRGDLKLYPCLAKHVFRH
jgi:hypothetical protein